MAEELPSDDQHIFSEFEDPERRDLIARLVSTDAKRFREIPLCNYLALWFSDIKILREYVSPNKTEKVIKRCGTLETTLKSIYTYDVASICKYP